MLKSVNIPHQSVHILRDTEFNCEFTEGPGTKKINAYNAEINPSLLQLTVNIKFQEVTTKNVLDLLP